MDRTSKPLLIVYAAAALAVAMIGARYLKAVAADSHARAGPVPGASSATGAAGGGTFASRSGAIVVHVAGAVRRPGVVRVRDGDRVGDAVSAAGGLASGADPGGVNLAARLADGQQVVVPRRAAAGAGSSGGGGPVSLSSATAEQLDGLDGIGPGLAEKIVDYRAQHGGFRSVDELSEVPGIGEKRLESLRAQLQP